MTHRYAAHRDFVRAARGSPDLGPVLVIVVLMELVFIIAPLLVGGVLPEAWRISYEIGATPLSLLAQLATFGVIALALVVMVRQAHGRGFWSMVGPVRPTLRNIKIAGFAVFWLLVLQTILPPWIVMADVASIRHIAAWAVWVIPAIAILLIQVGTEELYFRGYLQQQCAALSDKAWVWMGVPSLLFGLGHYLNGYGPADGVLYALWATMLGLACADLTARTGNIGAAIGLHLSNNIFAFMWVGEQDMPSSGLALFLYAPMDRSQFDYGLATLIEPWVLPEVIILTLMIVVMWLAARIAIRR